MTGTDELIHRALSTSAEYRAATQRDWADFQHRLHPTPPGSIPSNRRRWLLPAVAAVLAAALIVVGVFVGARTGAPNTVTLPVARLTIVSAPVASFACTGSDGQNMTTSTAARLPNALELGKPIEVGIRGSTFCAAFAEGFASTALAGTGPLRAFIATGGSGTFAIGVVDSTVTAITFTPYDPAFAPTSVTTVVDLGRGLRGFFIPVHTAGSVTVAVRGATVATTNVVHHGEASLNPTGVSARAVTSAAPQPQTVTCTSTSQFDNGVTIAVTSMTTARAPGTARLGYENVSRTAGDLPAQCLLVTEGGQTLTGQTALDTRQVLQYAGRVTGAHGTYQFISATGIATSIRLTRADGTISTLAAHQLTPAPNGFVAAVIYTASPDPVITQATAIDSNGRDLNTLRLP